MRKVIAMGLIASALSLLGCAPQLDDPGTWEDAVRSAASAALPADDLSVRWKVSGGLGEARNMVVEASADGTTTADLERVADEVEEAVAPAVVGLPVKDARLRIILTGEPTDGVTPTVARSVSLDDLAARYGLPRGGR